MSPASTIILKYPSSSTTSLNDQSLALHLYAPKLHSSLQIPQLSAKTSVKTQAVHILNIFFKRQNKLWSHYIQINLHQEFSRLLKIHTSAREAVAIACSEYCGRHEAWKYWVLRAIAFTMCSGSNFRRWIKDFCSNIYIWKEDILRKISFLEVSKA